MQIPGEINYSKIMSAPGDLFKYLQILAPNKIFSSASVKMRICECVPSSSDRGCGIVSSSRPRAEKMRLRRQ